MSLTLYAHPFAAYSWKVLIALYENGTPYRCRMVDNEKVLEELETLWPLKKFPVLMDDDAVIIESSIIIEHLTLQHPGSMRLIPAETDLALKVRFLDRFFDNYVMAPMQKLVSDRLRADGEHDARGVAEARTMLDRAYQWIEDQDALYPWAIGRLFTMGDCAAAPALFYADWVHPIPVHFPRVLAYRARLLARPSVARTVEEARPYRDLFPSGPPDRD